MPDQDERRGRQERRAAALVEKFSQDYPTYQYAFVEFLVDHLTDLSRFYRGDFEQILVLAIIGQRRLHARRTAADEGRSSDDAVTITASRLSDVTGIPRETVRRKLALMRDKGWVAQGADGSWSLVVGEGGQLMPVRRDHADFDMRARWRIARLIAALEQVGGQPER